LDRPKVVFQYKDRPRCYDGYVDVAWLIPHYVCADEIIINVHLANAGIRYVVDYLNSDEAAYHIVEWTQRRYHLSCEGVSHSSHLVANINQIFKTIAENIRLGLTRVHTITLAEFERALKSML